MAKASTPAWDQEAVLPAARDQVRIRVREHAANGRGRIHWVKPAHVDADIDAIAGGGRHPVVGSDMALWSWPADDLRRLSNVIRDLDGVLVFVEPTAGLGWRRPLQLATRRYRRDIPAELRAAGFIVTTQVRLRNGLYGTCVRGEARHFPPGESISSR